MQCAVCHNGGIYWVTIQPIVSEHSRSCDNNWTLHCSTLNRVAIIIICWLPRPGCLAGPNLLSLHINSTDSSRPVSSLCPPYVVTSMELGIIVTTLHSPVSGLWWSCGCEAPGAVSAHYMVSLHWDTDQSEARVERYWPTRELITTIFFFQATLYTLYTGCWCEMAPIGRQLGPSYSCKEQIRGERKYPLANQRHQQLVG